MTVIETARQRQRRACSLDSSDTATTRSAGGIEFLDGNTGEDLYLTRASCAQSVPGNDGQFAHASACHHEGTHTDNSPKQASQSPTIRPSRRHRHHRGTRDFNARPIENG